MSTRATAVDSDTGVCIGRLVEPLASLYGSPIDARRAVADASLDRLKTRLNFDDEPMVVWFKILVYASDDPEELDAIISVARRDFPDNEALNRALAENARVARRDPATLQPDVAPPGMDLAPPGPDSVPLVDRDELREVLRTELEHVNRNGRSVSVLLIGDSGVGKTRLAQTVVEAADGSGMVVLQARCVDRRAEALLPMRDALRSYRGAPPAPEVGGGTAVPQNDHARFMRSFLRTGDESSSGPQLGGSTKEGLYEGLAELLLGLAGRRGLCLVVDDLTDADQDTLHFLEYFLRRAADRNVIALGTVKFDLVEPDLQDVIDKWEADGSRVCPVPPLGPDDAATLISRLWRGSPLSDDRVSSIVAITGGNPFFIEQYIGLRLDDTALGTEIPNRVEAVLRRRLARLDEEIRAFLGVAAVALEANSGIDLLAHVAGLDMAAAERLLGRAAECRCLAYEPTGGVTFTQEVLRRVVHDNLGEPRRVQLHRRAAEWLESAGSFAAAAHHFDRAASKDDLVRAALRGAERAEHDGTYHKAIELYELAQPHGDPRVIGPRLAKAYLIVGQYSRAEEVLDRLPREAPEVRLLSSELEFVRGNFVRAREEIELALQTPSVDQVDVLIRLADINLYLGELARAAEHGNAALAHARGPNVVARCKGITGAASFFAGDIEGGERLFIEAMTALSSQPTEERDRGIYLTILANLGLAREARGHWDAARRFYEESLSKRRDVADARGVMQSLHAVARSDFALGAKDGARRSLAEVADMATRLSDRLEQGKVEHTYAQFDLSDNEASSAVQHAEAALQRFRDSGVRYDATHARFTLARAYEAAGSRRRAVEEAGAARVAMESGRFGFFRTLFPELAFPYGQRIAAGLLAYVYGDAFGLPWEGLAAKDIDVALLPSIPAARDWPRGSTSDDTALMLVVAELLVASPCVDAPAFLELLSDRLPIKGLGPSTTAAVEHFRRTGAIPVEGGNTNGALMRSLPIGWAHPLDHVRERRELTIELSRATHPGPEARTAACVGAACAAWAIEGADPSMLLDVAREEAAVVALTCDADGRINDMLRDLAAGQWDPNPARDLLDPYDTLASVLWCIVRERELPAALVAAVRIGGDADTVAALVGGLLGCQRSPDAVGAELSWHTLVQAPDVELIGRLAAGLVDLRVGRAGR